MQQHRRKIQNVSSVTAARCVLLSLQSLYSGTTPYLHAGGRNPIEGLTTAIAMATMPQMTL
jgi:hypothetical protein